MGQRESLEERRPSLEQDVEAVIADIKNAKGRLVRTGFGASGMDDLASAAKAGHLANLTEFNVSENSLGVDGCIAVSQLLHHCPSLQSLSLEECDFRDGPETTELLATISQAKALFHLNVAWNPIVRNLTQFLNRGASVFLQNLVMSSVLSLDCTDKLRTTCIAAVCKLIQANRLHVLGLSENCLVDSHVAMLCEALKGQGPLMVLDLERNTLTVDSLDLLRAAVKRSRIAVARLQGNCGLQDKDIHSMCYGDVINAAQVRGLENCERLPAIRQGSAAFIREGVNAPSRCDSTAEARASPRNSTSLWCGTEDA
eukprot:GEMP01058134.1.p1 GENE.GEMP01058134.1~~GEMP01058134.1.p1  ORF type:complete len:313 (+),score=63.80 GEMP01058134.1:281-1219(+)